MKEPSTLVRHMPCKRCPSSDGAALYSNGWVHCFVCNSNYKENDPMVGEEDEGTPAPKAKGGYTLPADYRTEPLRGIDAETCRLWGYYMVGEGDDKEHHAVHRDSHLKPCGAKVRKKGKQFSVRGTLAPLWGMHLWKGGGKKVVVTEGEIDALSVSYLQGNKWPVVSLANGAQSAAKSFKAALEWLESFDSVVLMFDMDEPGQKAAAEAAEVLSPGKAHVARLPLKDANECLKAGRGPEVIQAIWNAKPYRPDGVVCAADVVATMRFAPVPSTPFPWGFLNDKIDGMRPKELTVVTAGTGVGKSTVVAEIARHLLVSGGHPVGYIALEESVELTSMRFLSLSMGRPLHLCKPEDWPGDAEIEKAKAGIPWDRLFLYDHFGSMDPETLVGKVRYTVKGLGVRYVFLDHLSIVISGWDTDDERKALDVTMTKLRSLVEETGIHLVVVVHLRRNGEGKGHEAGREVSLSDLRGTQAIAQLSDNVIAVERNLQDDANTLRVRVLKERHGGRTGLAGLLRYDRDTGRLVEVQEAGGLDFPPIDAGRSHSVNGQDF